MKTYFNPDFMKNTIPQSTFYFSAYPLKALNLSEVEKKSYLHIYTKSDKSLKQSLNSKVFPLINPYPEHKIETEVEVKIKSSDQIEDRERDWFASYE